MNTTSMIAAFLFMAAVVAVGLGILTTMGQENVNKMNAQARLRSLCGSLIGDFNDMDCDGEINARNDDEKSKFDDLKAEIKNTCIEAKARSKEGQTFSVCDPNTDTITSTCLKTCCRIECDI